jgi:hypothetical protein
MLGTQNCSVLYPSRLNSIVGRSATANFDWNCGVMGRPYRQIEVGMVV